MSYSYTISFNSSDYFPLLPNNDITVKGEWVQDTFIFREKLSEVKITKTLNNSIYTTLESYFDDPTKFETRIYIKRLKNNVQDSIHWFGVKWGKIDEEVATYTVTPHPYDAYYQYLEEGIEEAGGWSYTSSNLSIYDEGTANYPLLESYTVYRLEEILKSKIDVMTAFDSANVVSSFMWGDAYEDATPAETIYGMHKDYVVSMPSVIENAALIATAEELSGMSVMDVIKLFGVFQVYCYLDSNGKLRFEHISYIQNEFTNNAVYLTVPSTFQKYEYNTQELPIREEIEFSRDGDDVDTDFRNDPIKYSAIRNRIDSTVINKPFDVFTNAQYYFDNSLTGYKVLFAGYKNLAMNWINSNMDAFDSTYNHIILEALSDGVNDKVCFTSDFKTSGTLSYSFNITDMTGTVVMSLKKRSTGATIGSAVTIDSTGLKTGTFSTSLNDDSFIELRTVASLSSFLQGDLIIEDNVGTMLLRNPWKTCLVSTLRKMNGDFCHANLLYNWWGHYRLSKSGTMNGSARTFLSTQYNLKRDTIKMYYDTAINPLYGINDGVRIGKIAGYTKHDTGFIELDLTYTEDE